MTRATIGRVEAAFFDLDRTIIARSTGLALSRTFMRAGLIPPKTLFGSLFAGLVFQLMGADEARMERMRGRAARLTAGWDAQRVRSIVDDVVEEVFSPLIYAEALELLDRHRESGRVLCIVSTSPEEVVHSLARILDVDRCISTRSRVIGGVFTGELEFYAFGHRKADAMHAMAAEMKIDLAASYAYSDSATDLPMLNSVGHPVCVNPDKELKRVAQQRGWPVTTFRNPVRIRARLVHLRLPQAAVGGTLAAAGVGMVVAATWWLIKKNSERLD
jgi:HAD superfamily hydrolase (TIGR01490 family)